MESVGLHIKDEWDIIYSFIAQDLIVNSPL